jgi:chorismate mutase
MAGSVLAAPPARPDAPLVALVDLAAQRLQVAEPVASAKWISHGAIEDPARVDREIAKLRAQAGAHRVDPDYVARVFGDQIHATEAIEYSRFADWKLGQTPPSGPAPDLSASRGLIDGFNEQMLAQIAADWQLLHSPDCATLLDAARGEVTRSRQLDSLYQRALSTATGSYCA